MFADSFLLRLNFLGFYQSKLTDFFSIHKKTPFILTKERNKSLIKKKSVYNNKCVGFINLFSRSL